MKYILVSITFCAALVLPRLTFAAVFFSDNFEVDPSANWTVNKGPATTDEAHGFFFDYSTVGIPAAPSGAGTRGLKLQANQSSGVFGGVSVSPNGQSFSGDYVLLFDWWENFNGPPRLAAAARRSWARLALAPAAPWRNGPAARKIVSGSAALVTATPRAIGGLIHLHRPGSLVMPTQRRVSMRPASRRAARMLATHTMQALAPFRRPRRRRPCFRSRMALRWSARRALNGIRSKSPRLGPV